MAGGQTQVGAVGHELMGIGIRDIPTVIKQIELWRRRQRPHIRGRASVNRRHRTTDTILTINPSRSPELRGLTKHRAKHYREKCCYLCLVGARPVLTPRPASLSHQRRTAGTALPRAPSSRIPTPARVRGTAAIPGGRGLARHDRCLSPRADRRPLVHGSRLKAMPSPS